MKVYVEVLPSILINYSSCFYIVLEHHLACHLVHARHLSWTFEKLLMP